MRSASTVVVMVVGMSAAFALALQAQQSPLAPICPSGRNAVLDSATVTLAVDAIRPYRDSTYSAEARQQVLYYADAIRQHFLAPSSLGDLPPLAVVTPPLPGDSDAGTSGVASGRLILVVKRNGRTRTVAWESYPLVLSLSSAIVKAVRAAEAAGAFDGIMRATDSADDDTLAIDILALKESDTPQLPLMRALIVGYIAESPPMVAKAGQMEYPEAARQRAVSTEGAVRFVIGADGKAISSSIQVTKAGWRDFVRPMTRAIETSTFIAAKSGGCAVPSLATQAFTYQIRQ